MYSSSVGHRRESRQSSSRPCPRCSESSSSALVCQRRGARGARALACHDAVERGVVDRARRRARRLDVRAQREELLVREEVHVVGGVDRLRDAVDLVRRWRCVSGAVRRGRRRGAYRARRGAAARRPRCRLYWRVLGRRAWTGRAAHSRLALCSMLMTLDIVCSLSCGTFSQALNASSIWPRMSLPGTELM